MSEQILPCPFCKKMPYVHNVRGEFVRVSCDNQGKELPHIEIVSVGNDRADAIQNWNDDVDSLLADFTITPNTRTKVCTKCGGDSPVPLDEDEDGNRLCRACLEWTPPEPNTRTKARDANE